MLQTLVWVHTVPTEVVTLAGCEIDGLKRCCWSLGGEGSIVDNAFGAVGKYHAPVFGLKRRGSNERTG